MANETFFVEGEIAYYSYTDKRLNDTFFLITEKFRKIQPIYKKKVDEWFERLLDHEKEQVKVKYK